MKPSSSTARAPRSASARARSRAGTPPICSGSCCARSSSATTSIRRCIDDVVGGCVTQSGEQGCNVTRNAWVAAGLPWSVPATSVDRQCGSSQQAAHFVAQGVIAGAYDIGDRVRRRVDDAGADVVERARRHRPVQPASSSRNTNNTLGIQFWVAQVLADKWGITREEMDAYALQSHQRGMKAGLPREDREPRFQLS